MSDEKRDEGSPAVPDPKWEQPSIEFVGHVSEIFQFPGGGKLSLMAEDMGDEQRKPKGQG